MTYNPNTIANRKTKDRQKRKKLRDKLLAEGIDQQRIDAIIAQKRRADKATRREAEQQRLAAIYATDAFEYSPDKDAGYYPDDTGYQPSPGDPLLRGPGRVQGITAKVVRRGSTITEHQYERAVRGTKR